MPSVRWLLIAVIAVYSQFWIKPALSAELSDPLPVASNGWRPIVGTHEVKPYATIEQNQKQTISLTADDQDAKNNDKNKKLAKPNNKGVNGNQLLINHHGSSGHQSKLQPPPPSVKQMAKSGKPALRHPVINKLHAHLALSSTTTGKRYKTAKPHRHQIRDEILAPAPSSAIGSYAYFNQGPLSIQNKPFHSPGHIDFSNHFGFSNSNNDGVVPQQYSYQKHPSQNELQSNHFVYFNQNDEFTRNLVPPPPAYKPQGEKDPIALKDSPQAATINTPQIVIGKHKDDRRRLPENLVLQVPPLYNQYQPQFDLEITKENFKEYHTTLAPSSYKTSTESFIDTTKFAKQKVTAFSGYEVTEDKDWADHISPYKNIYLTQNIPPGVFKQKFHPPENKYHFSHRPGQFEDGHFQNSQQDDASTQFLPTPYIPDNTYPTSPTQAEVSTIYSEISQLNKKNNLFKAPNPTTYSIKEVATHFPIFDTKKPVVFSPAPTAQTIFEEHDITKPTQQTSFPTVNPSTDGNQRKPTYRRRKPSRLTTTTEETDINTDNTYDGYQSEIENEPQVIKPQRRRRPIKLKTTEAPKEEITNFEVTTRPSFSYRPKPTRHQPQTITEEIFVSKVHRHKPTYILPNQHFNEEEPTTENYPKYENPVEEVKQNEHVELVENPTSEATYANHQYEEENEETERPVKIIKRKRLRPTSTTENLPSTNLNIPENELDYTTIPSGEEQSEESATYRDNSFESDKEHTTLTTAHPTSRLTTTTTTEAPTTKSNRLRRPIKYDAQRPRFSVKDYRQRLNQYMSSTSTTEATKHNLEPSTPRIRYPNRFKFQTNVDNEESTEPIRQKFTPKEPRRKFTTSESPDINTTEKSRTANTRLKSFARYRSSTEAPTTTTTQKVSIKPNIFNNLKRPQQLSLRNRIYLKRNLTTTESYVDDSENDSLSNTEKADIAIPFQIAESKVEVTTHELEQQESSSTTEKPNVNLPQESDDSSDDAETFLQLQRISELTSSAHKQYNTPGMFKSVSPTSRRVPNYFTIATEDPILPIEAFFPNLNQKTNDRS